MDAIPPCGSAGRRVHRGRAWKVVFQDLELEARLTQYWNGEMTHEGHDYRAVVLVLEREWTAV